MIKVNLNKYCRDGYYLFLSDGRQTNDPKSQLFRLNYIFNSDKICQLDKVKERFIGIYLICG